MDPSDVGRFKRSRLPEPALGCKLSTMLVMVPAFSVFFLLQSGNVAVGGKKRSKDQDAEEVAGHGPKSVWGRIAIPAA